MSKTMMQFCSKCHEERDGSHQTYCKVCYATYTRERRAAKREEYNAYQRAYSLANPDKRLRSKRKWELRTKYGMTEPEVQELLESQGGRCAICNRSIEYGGNKQASAVVDHDHATGRVRGLLCTPCNRGIGLFGDDPQALIAASMYLIQRTD